MGIFYLQYVCIYNIKTKCKCYVTCLVPISQALFSLGPDSAECKISEIFIYCKSNCGGI